MITRCHYDVVDERALIWIATNFFSLLATKSTPIFYTQNYTTNQAYKSVKFAIFGLSVLDHLDQQSKRS